MYLPFCKGRLLSAATLQVPTGPVSQAKDNSGLGNWGQKLGLLYRRRMLNGRRGSSDDHPLLVTARDDPVRASQKPYGTREEGLMRGVLQEFGEKGAGRAGRGTRGAWREMYDATRLTASRL